MFILDFWGRTFMYTNYSTNMRFCKKFALSSVMLNNIFWVERFSLPRSQITQFELPNPYSF